MLEIINSLKPFFEDCYREIGVREYAREIKVAAPTASKMLKNFASQNLLKKREERGFLLFQANRESTILRNLSRIYWEEKLKPLIEYLEKILHPDAIVLFGSLAKLEVNEKSDIDLAIFTKFKKNGDVENFKEKLGKEIQLFVFESLEKVNKELRIGISNGCILKGTVR
jgi:predicted nucleotidyltransferase